MPGKLKQKWALALIVSQCVHLTRAASNLAVPWSTTYYGPDGPWQAVTVQVGGVNSQGTTQVDLIPGGKYGCMILSKEACANYPDTPCGKGGLWEPAYKSDTDTLYRADWFNNAGFKIGGGEEYVQAMTVNGQTVPNVPLVSIDDITFTAPDGKQYGPELGTLALGGNGAVQFQNFVTAKTDSTRSGFMITGGLFNQSITPSYSYGLHIGAANFNYGGSLVLGGYDKGRIVGKYTNFSADTVTLLDIGLDVESGGSPFSNGLKSQTGLLISNLSEPTTLPVTIDPGNPYLYLPGKTCEELAKRLPITYDTSLRYYLWDTDDPTYHKIMSSPAYMSFIFPPATGDEANVTIKVPFSLLNLTLDTPLVSKPTPYFPCIDFLPLSGYYHSLGRAFLQAAFIGHNYRSSMSWLGQAPGPGSSRNGLGTTRVDIADDDDTIEPSDDSNSTWADSWSDYWTVLADDGTQTGTPKSTPTVAVNSNNDNTLSPSSSPQSLSAGAIAGVVIGVVALAGVIAGGILWWRLRRRNAHTAAVQASEAPDQKCPYGCAQGTHTGQCPYRHMLAPQPQPVELWAQPAMLYGTHVAHELPTQNLNSPRELASEWRRSRSSSARPSTGRPSTGRPSTSRPRSAA